MAKVGRPSDYTNEIATEICKRIEEGETIREICALPHMPVWETIRGWKLKYPEFLAQYTQAREESAYALEDEAFKISKTAVDKDSAAAARVQIDTIKWAAGKRNKSFNDRISIDHSGEIKTTTINDQQLIDKLNAIIDAAPQN